MIGYPVSLKIIDKLIKPKTNEKKFSYKPSVTYMIVAHNEEKVIEKKLENSLTIDYPSEKFEILVTSDSSTDSTNRIVQRFIDSHPEKRIRLFTTTEHKGKTNAQNEAQKTVKSEILVMTDANSIVKSDAIKQLVSCFTDSNVAYVCGKLEYSNEINSQTGNSEITYWNIDLYMRDIESRLQTITAGNGALYACRNKEYLCIDPIYCHDNMMPYLYALQNKRAIFNPEAIAYEKTGSNNNDEFKRKVRMNRYILTWFKKGIKPLNFIKYKWFSLFFFGHRLSRYSLWLAHFVAFISCFIALLQGKKWGKIFTVLQSIFGIIAIIALKFKLKNKLIRMIGYYTMTVFAQVVGIKNTISGTSKATWEKAESTR